MKKDFSIFFLKFFEKCEMNYNKLFLDRSIGLKLNDFTILLNSKLGSGCRISL